MTSYSTPNMPESDLLRPALNRKPCKEANGKWYFREVDVTSETTDSFDRIKLAFKQYPRLYYLLMNVFSPVCGNTNQLRSFVSSASGLVLNIGSGNIPRQKGIINIDMMDYDNVDIVCDIHDLPFQDNSIHAVMSVAVLEHVKEPLAVLREVHRVLKPGGRVLSVIPFMQPFHASPHDYQRYTLPGIEYLHREFSKIESGVFSGPVSGALWVVQELIASLLSFGSERIRNALTIALMLITWPIKFLDLLASRLPTSSNLASNFYFHGAK